MARRRVMCLWAAACLSVAQAQSQVASPTFAVSELVTQALERNRDLLAARQRLAEAQGLLRQAGVRLAPTVEVEAGTGRPLGTRGEEEYSAGFFYPFETGGKRQKRVSVAELGIALAEAEVAERTRQLAFEIKRRAAELLAARRKQDAIDRLLGLSRESYQVTKTRVDQGDAAPLEGQLLVAELGRVEAQQATFAGRASAGLLDLRQVIGLTGNESFGLREEAAPATDDVSLDALKDRARASRPDLRGAQLLEQQAGAELALQNAQGRPDVTASARYIQRNSFFEQSVLSAMGTATQLHDRDNVLTLGISVPLFTQRRNVGNVEAAVARERAARLRKEYLEGTIPLEVEAAYRRWIAAQRALTLFQQGVIDQSERNLAVIRQAYTLGQLRVLDVLAEQRRLIDTELAYIDTQADLAQATAELERAVGGNLR